MARVEALARLNPKNCRFDVGSGGIPELTPEIVAGACAGLPEIAYRLALVKYAGQEREVQHLKIRTLMLAADLAIKHGWGKPVPGQLRGISDFAIWAVVGYHHCPRCNGAGVFKDDWRTTRTCPACKGDGKASAAAFEERGQMAAGIGKEAWENGWRVRGKLLARHLSAADRRVSRQLNFQLTEVLHEKAQHWIDMQQALLHNS